MATASKQRIVTHILTSHGKIAKIAGEEPAARPILEEFIYAVLREGASRDAADQAYEMLRKNFFDWNEVRVSAPQELCDVIDPFVNDPLTRSQRIIEFLQEVFETTFSFDLDSIEKKGMKQAAKTLSRYTAANDYTVAWVTQSRLGGHAIPIDSPSLRTLRRLQIIDDEQIDLETIRASLEHQIPKAKGSLFVDAISEIALRTCGEKEPTCPECTARTACPTGLESKRPALKKPR